MAVGEAIEKLVSPATKLVECIKDGIGVLYEPTHIKRMAKAKAFEIETISKATKNNLELPITYHEGKLSMNSEDVNHFLQRTQSRIVYEELRKQQNIENIIGNAYTELETEDKVSSERVNKDWLSNFFQYAEDINEEEMQKAWGRILAGEIKSPGAFSLRTLDKLSKISMKEAVLFEKLGELIIYTSTTNEKIPIIYNKIPLLAKYGVSFEDLLVLEDCGLVRIDGSLNVNYENEGKIKISSSNQILILETKHKNFSLGIFAITESGKQILKIINKKSNDNYFLEVAKSIKERYNVEASLHEIINDNDIEISYSEENLLK